MTHLQKAGWLSVGTIFFWALLNVTLRYCVVEYGCHPLAIACSNAVFCALALLAIGSKEVNIRQILQSVQTWFFGITQILKNICMIYVFVYISSTEANLLTNIEIVLSVLLTWMILKRRPGWIDGVAMAFIILGCALLLTGLPDAVVAPAALWVFAASLLTSLRSIVAEVHPANKGYLSVRDRCAVTGWILLAGSIVFVLVFAGLSLWAACLPSEVLEQTFILKKMPAPAEYFYLPSVLGGMVTGVLFYAISMYFYFYAISLSTNEYFMLSRSLQAVFTYGVETVFAFFGALPLVVLSASDWFAALAIIFSSLSMLLVRSERGRKLLKLLNLR